MVILSDENDDPVALRVVTLSAESSDPGHKDLRAVWTCPVFVHASWVCHRRAVPRAPKRAPCLHPPSLFVIESCDPER